MNHRLAYTSNKGFTLLELIIVIIIVGILAAVGLSSYSTQTERGRISEAMAQMSAMKKLAYEYYLKNGSLANVQNSDVDVDFTCTSKGYFRYRVGDKSASRVRFDAWRCTAGGKEPNGTCYEFFLVFFPNTGKSACYCEWCGTDDACYGFSKLLE